MNKQSFSEKNLKKILQTRHRKARSLKSKPTKNSLSVLSKSITDKSFTLDDFNHYNSNNKIIYTTAIVDDDIVLAKLNSNIAKAYNLRQSDRHSIVKQVISLLKEETPKYIYKFDISDFYESINPIVHCSKILENNFLSAESNFVLTEYIRVLEKMIINGMPRGIGLSSTISELVMNSFDKQMKSNQKIYFYTRFVDDILIFSTERINIKNEIIKFLPDGLKLNWKKNKVIAVTPCRCYVKCICSKAKCNCFDKRKCKTVNAQIQNFDFLGYNFEFPELSFNKSSEKLKVGLSNKKTLKLKNRLYKSFRDYHNNGNYNLLENRIKFLTGNHFISNGKHKSDRMKSGVYYNYIHLTSLTRYEELDLYLKKMIHAKVSTKIFLNNTHKKSLNKYSFISGFKCKFTEIFNGNQINKIKGCW
ncbi:RNA-directed DNA polymerase [Enterobacter hormaechei]|uniref:antiviral reverse transcriptase Drt3a n=2 Tax=Enterobacter hormaechei TaxID=158836 RepID=UPI001E4151CF|nr:antiviral reverse transcriptase Drt3a [Enterobacter hormaechei]MCC4540506.1 RNA-directed DNA polymerase [Enterobacter hormaechei]MCC4549444.1 RNA-directed DNA polymerase [Enterobacter hormaechei]